MSGCTFPVVVEGSWTAAQAKSVKNKLQIYFQSNKKSSGGECQVEVEESAPRAVVSFSSEEVRARVLARENHEIIVGSNTVKLHLSTASSQASQSKASPANEGKPKSSASPKPTPEDETPTKASTADEEVEIVGVVLDKIGDIPRDVLALLVESISSLETGDYNLEVIFEVNKAVVTFNNTADTLSFISKCENNKKLQKRGVTAWPLEAPKSIRVENLSASASDDVLELFFEKVLDCPENISLIPDERAAVLSFSDSKVLRNLKRDYKISSTPVKVYPYYHSLGAALYGEDRPTWKMPEPFTEKVHHVIFKFLLQKNLVRTVNEQMRPHFCSVDMGQAEVTLRPLPSFLRQSGLTREKVDAWQSNAQSAFRQQMAEFSAFECPANQAAWRESENRVLSVLKEDGVPVMDTSRGVLTVAGHADSMKQIRATVEDVMKAAMSRIERETNGIKEVIDLPPAVFHILKESGLQKRVVDSYPELKLAYADGSQQLSIEGLPTEVYQTKSWVFEMIPKISRKPLNLPPPLLEFLAAVNIADLSRDLFTSHEIWASLSIDNKQAVLIGASEKAIQDAESKMKSDLHYRMLDIEDTKVLKLQGWKDLQKNLLESYNSPQKQTLTITFHPDRKDKVTVAGFRGPVDEATNDLQTFLSSYAHVQDSLRVKSCALVHFIEKQRFKIWASFSKDCDVTVTFKTEQRRILLEGFRLNVQLVKSKLAELAEGLFCDSLVVEKPGAKKYCQKYANTFLPSLSTEFDCAVVLQPDHQEEEEEEAAQFPEGKIVHLCQVRTTDGVLVSVGEANICSLTVDAIVNAANEDLDHIGGLALAIVRAAGPKMQAICNDYISKNGKLQSGDAITTEPCDLPCKFVVHAVGPRFHQMDRKTCVSRLKLVVKRSLEEAERKRCKSIALPAISSGVFGFPVGLCAETIAQAVREYCDRSDGPISLEEIHLVDNSQDTVKALAAAVNSEFSDLNPVMMLPPEEERRRSGTNRDPDGADLDGNRNQPTQLGKVKKNEKVTNLSSGGNRGMRGHGPRKGNASSGHSEQRLMRGHVSKPNKRKPTIPGGLNISLREGNIQDQTTAVIVNTIDISLDLSMGAVSKAILRAAGPALQQGITSSPGSAFPQFGDVLITDGFNLKSQKVFHAICPHWDKGNAGAQKALKSIIRFCLEEAEKQGLSSISIPAIGTGNLKFPRTAVCGILQRQIQDFIRTGEYRHLKEVVIVVHPSDQETVKCFRSAFESQTSQKSAQEDEDQDQEDAAEGEDEDKGEGEDESEEEEGEPDLNRTVDDPSLSKVQQPTDCFGQVSCPSLGVHQMQMGPLVLEVLSGDITKEAVDVIVDSSGVCKSILEAARSAVEQECQTIANKPCDMILTKAGSLPSKYIIHIDGADDVPQVKDIVYKVLKQCEFHQFCSVSFPAIGTVQAGADPAKVAEAMIDAVVDFIRKKGPTCVRKVKLVLYQADMVSEFFKCMKNMEGKPVAEKGFFDKFKDTISSYLWKSEKDSPRPKELDVKREEFEPAVFLLCADTRKTLTQVKKKIEDLLVDEQDSRTINDWFISLLAPEDIKQLEALQREMTVCIRLDKGTQGQAPHILLEGLTRDVASADATIRELLRKVERQDNLRSKAELTASLVEWKYEDETGSCRVFDMFTNLQLEEALKNQKKVRININGTEHDVDTVTKKAVSTRGRGQMELFRRDLKEEPGLPSNWGDMSDDLIKLFPLTPEDQDYHDLEQKLRTEGFTGTITLMERVQNRTLWQSYQLLKKEMEKKNKHQNNELVLYHGTKSNAVDFINKQGFNRSYAGMHGALFGNGCYFAVDPMYSYKYAKPDANNVRRMYVARVLVGDFVKGNEGMITPPSRNTGQTADLYDSVVDQDPNPTIHVVFKDIQAYPEYLVTFT